MTHRKLRAEGNPLRRAADRTRARWHAAFALACVLAVAVGVLAALAVRTADTRTAQAQAAHRHRVTATVTAAPTPAVAARSGGRATTAQAVWRYPADVEHTGTVPVAPRTRARDRVPLWVDDRGEAARAPATARDIVLTAVGVGAGVCALTALCAGGVVHLRLRRVQAQSLRAWEQEWEQVEPRWTGRLRPGPGAGDD
ncbi:hypothetical protein [Streptomyces sp. NPDC101132]|uniref:Rv1733c family protein n=1 Tax=Streptomyces sp. NPDC101132 TaxID=3366110 RepID=UPI003804BAB8